MDGRPSEVILDLAQREGADLIVMGTHGRTGLSHVLLGSVAERVVRQAECPVMTVPPGKGASGGGLRVMSTGGDPHPGRTPDEDVKSAPGA